MNDYTTTPSTEPGYYIYINKYTHLVEIINLDWKYNDDSEDQRLYNYNAHENNWGPDRGWLWDNDGLWKKIDMPNDPKRLIKEFYG